MCPHGYHHNGFMANPALGTQEVRLHVNCLDCIVKSPECSNCEQSAMHSRVETSTDFATRVPNTHYPTGTRVLVTVNLVFD